MGSGEARQTLDEIRREIDAEYGAGIPSAVERARSGGRRRHWQRRARPRVWRTRAIWAGFGGLLAANALLAVGPTHLLPASPPVPDPGAGPTVLRIESASALPAAWAGMPSDQTGPRPAERPTVPPAPPTVLRGLLQDWIDATNTRDLERQRSFYPTTVAAYYRAREIPRDLVVADKARQFQDAEVIEVEVGPPDIVLDPDGRSAVMRFRKRYVIRGERLNRRGEVEQELRWTETDDGWRIVSERDVRVIR